MITAEDANAAASRMAAGGRGWGSWRPKVFIVDLADELGQPLPVLGPMLLRWHRAGTVELVRADLVGAMGPAKVRDSELDDGIGRYHFIVPPGAPAATVVAPAPRPRGRIGQRRNPGDAMLHYAAIGPTGTILGIQDNVTDALELVRRSGGGPVQLQELDHNGLVPNPIAADRMPQVALRNTGLPEVPSSALDMPLTEAFERLRPFFRGLMKRGKLTLGYDTKVVMADNWMGQNYKTGKTTDEDPSKVMGVTLVPASHPALAARGEGPYALLRTPERRADGEKMINRWRNELPVVRGNFTLCSGSNANCRDSCLVFAGNNAAEIYNTYRKVAQTMSLLNEPAAFLRMLVEAIEKFVRSKEIRSGTVPFIRLNVLSDIPWELVAPWLFDRFPGLQFYDYTKVPGRAVPGNYDITFSVSGTNFEWAHEEVHQRERRVAVVFLGHRQRDGGWRPIKDRGQKLVDAVPLPRSFWGLPVVDGDISDVRPRDPAPACVGLRWKTPSGKRAGVTVDIGSPKFSFVTPVYVVDDEGTMARPNPGQSQWLVAPVTPRYQPITHDVAQPAE